MSRVFGRILATTACLAVLAVVGIGGTVGAHAELESTTPAADSTVPTAPASLTLRFTEPVSVAAEGVRLFDPDGRAASGVSATASGRDVSVTMPSDAGNGTWTVSWSVVSNDGHPISSAYVFHIGAPAGGADVGAVTAGPTDATRWMRIIGRLAAMLALAVLISPALWRPLRRRVEMISTALFWAGIALSSASELWSVRQGGAADLGEAMRIWLSTTSGSLMLTTIVLAAVAHVLTLGTHLRRPLTALAWWGVLMTLVLSGHASVLPPAAASAVLTIVHVGAALVWAGGVWDLDRRPRPWEPETVRRLTSVATVAVALIGLSGIALSLLRVSPGEQFDSPYGSIIGLKAGLWAVAVGLAAVNRFRLAPRLVTEPDHVTHLMRLYVRLELVAIGAAMLFGSVLASTPPPTQNAAEMSPVTTQAPGETYTYNAKFGIYEAKVSAGPLTLGTNTFEVSIIDPVIQRTPLDLTELKVSVVNEEAGVGPIEIVDDDPEDGALTAVFDLTTAGDWTVVVDGRRGEFEFLRAEVGFELSE